MHSPKRIVFDTNIWVFGLRQHKDIPACKTLLQNLPKLFVVVPRQILLELQINLTEFEFRDFFNIINSIPKQVKIDWREADATKVNKYQQRGCKLGDAIICAHLEELGIKTLVSENRDFLKEIREIPFRVVNSEKAVKELLE